MPKNKRPIESTRTSSRRQASKEALKQMQLLLDDEDEDAFVIPDDENDKKDFRLEPPPPPPPKKRAISPIMDSPAPKKKYKLSHRKSSDGNDRDVIVLKSISNSNYVPKENTLELECYVEDLSDVQKERQKKAEYEERELQAKLEELLKSKKAEVVYKGEINSAVEVNELITNCGKKSIFKPSEIPQLDEKAPAFHLVMDPRLGLIVGTFTKTTNKVQTASPTVTKSKLQISAAVKDVATIPQNATSTPGRTTRTRKGIIAATPPPTIQTRGNNTIPTRANSHGVVTRGNANTPRSNNSTPSRAVPQMPTPAPSPSIQTRGMKAAPTIQTRNNKATPPTTSKRPVANAPVEKPSKQVVDLTSEDNRNQADNREIAFNKLQGKTYPSLVVVARPHLRVTDLGVDRPKLDSKVKSVLMHPPTKFTEWLIQQGLIRAEQKCCVHSNTQLKLGMYSDVSKFPFSGGYVWISECCPQRFVSVFNGSIFEGSPHPPMVMLKLIYHWSCQTNIQNVTQWVKVDNLYVKGVYTWLRGVCTMSVQSRLHQLGGPGIKIEVGVISLGTTSHDGNQRQVKVEVLGVLETTTKYIRLRAVEPMPDGDRNFRKKFSKILEPILQWVHPASTIITDLTVDKATLHHMGFTNVFQTTSNEYNQSNRTIMEYLRRIVPRMFQNTLSLLSRQIIQQFLDELVWREWFGTTSQTAFDNIIAHLAEQTRSSPQMPLVIKLNKIAANPFRSWNSNSQNQVASNSATPAPATPAPSTPTPVPTKTPVTEVKKYGRKKSNSPQVQVVQERPTKPVSPDVPEQMVPLENYYYGTIDTVNTTPSKITLSMKCPFCKSSFDNNILLQNHLFKHAHNVSNDVYLCRYCLTSVSTANELIHHVNKCHPGETKFDYGFVCLICEIHYMNPFILGKHMSKEHIPHELPYQCGSCSFRCSNHKQVIDHFYMKHDGGSSIQCPFCLKSTTVWSGGRNVAQNIHYFIQHLQKHQKKQFAKRCGKCNLWFVQKEVLKEHQQKMHISLRGKVGLVPYPSPRNGVMVPKSKTDKNPCDAEVINFASLYYNLANNSICKECNQPISSSKHFPSFDNCQNPNCQYSTCCAIAMMTHNAKCKGLNSVIPPEALPFEMFCVCGFKEVDGNSMAKHLAVCEKKSAYPSEADAKSATVMHSMLDILGLVRKPEESKNEKPSDNSDIQEKNESTEESCEVSNKEMDSNEIDVLSDEEMGTVVSNRENVNEIPVEVDSENAAPEYKKDKQIKSTNLGEISDKNDNISDEKKDMETLHNEKSEIVDLDEEDVIMSEFTESDNICDKTQTTGIDHLSLTQNESQDQSSEITNSNSEDKQVNLHTIEKSIEQKIEKGHIDMEVNENLDENTADVSGPKMTKSTTDETIEMESNKIETKTNEKDIETDNAEKDIEIDHTEEDNIKTDHTENKIETDQTEKDIETDQTEKNIETDQTEKDIKADHTEKDIETDHTEIDIETDHTEKDTKTDQTEEVIETDQTEKDIETDHSEKDIETDHTKKCIDTDRTEKNDDTDTEKNDSEKEIGASHIVEEDIKVDHDEKNIEMDITENEVEEEYNSGKEKSDPTEIVEVNQIKKEEIKPDQTENEEMSADHTMEEEIEKITVDHENKIDVEESHIEKQDIQDHFNDKMKVNHIVEENEEYLAEKTVQGDLDDKSNEIDHIEEATVSKTNKAEIEDVHIQIQEGMDIDNENKAETLNIMESDNIPIGGGINTTNCLEEGIENMDPDSFLIQEKLDSNETNDSEENLPKLSDLAIIKNTVEESSHLNEQIDAMEDNHESSDELVSEKRIDSEKNCVTQFQTEPCTSQIELNETEESIPPVDVMDCSEISTSCMESKELGEVMDNSNLLNSEPCIQSENEDTIKDILPTDDVMPINLNSTQDSTSMDVD